MSERCGAAATSEIMKKCSLLRLQTMVAMKKCMSSGRCRLAGHPYMGQSKAEEVVLALGWRCIRVCPPNCPGLSGTAKTGPRPI